MNARFSKQGLSAEEAQKRQSLMHEQAELEKRFRQIIQREIDEENQGKRQH
ncbi:MAG TPA: hypothetical protein VJI67_01275 [archaeon]|nr:hypothetical protein [archaeon]HLD81153.1 hypothetical protein [archaeon]